MQNRHGNIFEMNLAPYYAKYMYFVYFRVPKPPDVVCNFYMPVIAYFFDILSDAPLVEHDFQKETEFYLSPLYIHGYGRVSKLFKGVSHIKPSKDWVFPHNRTKYSLVTWFGEERNPDFYTVSDYKCNFIVHDQPLQAVAHLEHKPFLPEELIFRLSYEVQKRTGMPPQIPFNEEDLTMAKRFYEDVLTVDKQPSAHPFQLASEQIQIAI